MAIDNPGFITAYYGPMFASKTTKLLEHALHAHYSGKWFKAFRPQMDMTRYQRLQDHGGKYAIDATAVPDARSILGYAGKADLFLIDEGMLFDSGIVDVLKELRGQGKSAVVTLVDRLWNGDWFPLQRGDPHPPGRTSKDIIKLADYAELVQGRCNFPSRENRECQSPSRFTCTLDTDKKVNVGKAQYFAACGHHYAMWRTSGLQPFQVDFLNGYAALMSTSHKNSDPLIIPEDPKVQPYHEERQSMPTPPPRSIGIRTEA